MAHLSGIVPQLVAAMGPCTGNPALMAQLSDIVVMVQGTSMLAAGGPPIADAAIGKQVTKEELGGSYVHCHISGVGGNEAKDDEECLRIVRRYPSYFPTNVYAAPARVAPSDNPERRDKELLSIVPRNRKRPYNMVHVMWHVVGHDTLSEQKPHPGNSVVTRLARMDGDVVGLVGNQPLNGAGIIDGAASDKITHFIQLCDGFYIPLIFLSDVPGFMTGSVSERYATLRRGVRIAYAMAYIPVPRVSVVLRKAYSMGQVAIGHKSGQIPTFVLPSGEFAALPVQRGADAGHKCALDETEEGERTREELGSH